MHLIVIIGPRYYTHIVIIVQDSHQKIQIEEELAVLNVGTNNTHLKHGSDKHGEVDTAHCVSIFRLHRFENKLPEEAQCLWHIFRIKLFDLVEFCMAAPAKLISRNKLNCGPCMTCTFLPAGLFLAYFLSDPGIPGPIYGSSSLKLSE